MAPPASSSGVVPSTSGLGDFHSRRRASTGPGSSEWRVPLLGAGRGGASGHPCQALPRSRILAEAHPQRPSPLATARDIPPPLANLFIHSLSFIYSVSIHSLLQTGRLCWSFGCTPTQASEVDSSPDLSGQMAFSYFSDYASQVFGSANRVLVTQGMYKKEINDVVPALKSRHSGERTIS